jgi:hypothetical protein
MSAFYVEGYLSFSLPAILAGLLAPMTGFAFGRIRVWRIRHRTGHRVAGRHGAFEVAEARHVRFGS